MEAHHIEEEFANKLNSLRYPTREDDVDAICFFIEDFQKLAPVFVSQLIGRLTNPYYPHNNQICLFYVIHAIINNFSNGLSQHFIDLFKPSIIGAVSEVLLHVENNTATMITDIVKIWIKKNIFGDQITAGFKNVIAPKNIQIYTLQQVNPLSFNTGEHGVVEETHYDSNQEDNQQKKQRTLMKGKDEWIVSESGLCEKNIN